MNISILQDLIPLINILPHWLGQIIVLIFLFIVFLYLRRSIRRDRQQDNVKVVQELEVFFDKKLISLEYGDYIDNHEAYKNAVSIIEKKISDANSAKITIDVKFTVVGMKYSWHEVLEPIIRLLKSNEKISLKLQILLVSPEYINSLHVCQHLANWAEEAKEKIKKMCTLIDNFSESSGERLNVEIKTYDSIPQYHGIIIDDEHLFLGRTDWIFNNGSVELTVGENRYRYFTSAPNNNESTKERRRERVNLFLNWHIFYWLHFSSKTVLHYLNGKWIKRPDNTKQEPKLGNVAFMHDK